MSSATSKTTRRVKMALSAAPTTTTTTTRTRFMAMQEHQQQLPFIPFLELTEPPDYSSLHPPYNAEQEQEEKVDLHQHALRGGGGGGKGALKASNIKKTVAFCTEPVWIPSPTRVTCRRNNNNNNNEEEEEEEEQLQQEQQEQEQQSFVWDPLSETNPWHITLNVMDVEGLTESQNGESVETVLSSSAATASTCMAREGGGEESVETVLSSSSSLLLLSSTHKPSPASVMLHHSYFHSDIIVALPCCSFPSPSPDTSEVLDVTENDHTDSSNSNHDRSLRPSRRRNSSSNSSSSSSSNLPYTRSRVTFRTFSPHSTTTTAAGSPQLPRRPNQESVTASPLDQVHHQRTDVSLPERLRLLVRQQQPPKGVGSLPPSPFVGKESPREGSNVFDKDRHHDNNEDQVDDDASIRRSRRSFPFQRHGSPTPGRQEPEINPSDDDDDEENVNDNASSSWYTSKDYDLMRMRDRVLVQLARQGRRWGTGSGSGGGTPLVPSSHHGDENNAQEDEEEDATHSLLGLEQDISVDGSKRAAQSSRSVVFKEQVRQRREQLQEHQQQQQQQQQARRKDMIDPERLALVYAPTTRRACHKAQRRAHDLALLIRRQDGLHHHYQQQQQQRSRRDTSLLLPLSPKQSVLPLQRSSPRHGTTTIPRRRSLTLVSTQKIANEALSPTTTRTTATALSSAYDDSSSSSLLLSPWSSSSPWASSSSSSSPRIPTTTTTTLSGVKGRYGFRNNCNTTCLTPSPKPSRTVLHGTQTKMVYRPHDSVSSTTTTTFSESSSSSLCADIQDSHHTITITTKTEHEHQRNQGDDDDNNHDPYDHSLGKNDSHDDNHSDHNTEQLSDLPCHRGVAVAAAAMVARKKLQVRTQSHVLEPWTPPLRPKARIIPSPGQFLVSSSSPSCYSTHHSNTTNSMYSTR